MHAQLCLSRAILHNQAILFIDSPFSFDKKSNIGTQIVHATELIKRIPVPAPSQKKLAFCTGNKVQRVVEWANMLRPTQIEKTSSLLYTALPQVNDLITPAQSRLEMLEHLRPYVQHTLDGLSKHFLHSPLALTNEAKKSAIVAQALQKHMVDGYILCIKDLLKNKKLKAGDSTLALCIHRAITGIGLLFLRSYQIYTNPPKNLWLALHTLFRVADMNELLDQKVTDPVQRIAKLSSIQDVYLSTALLFSARPHQLSQNDIAALYPTLREWATFIRFQLELSDNPDNFYCINLDSDFGPLYKTRIEEAHDNDLIIELDYRPLLSQLTKQRGETRDQNEAVEDMGAASIELPKEINSSLLDHLLEVWSNIAQRKQDRRPIEVTADMCVGLADCHYYLSGGQEFSDFVRSTSSTGEADNTLSRGFTPKDSFTEDESVIDQPINRVVINNVSQGGYSVTWNSSNPIKVESGNVVGLREFGRRVWVLGIVRWIRQRAQSTQLGIQIISDKASPYGIAQAYDMGGYSDYMRAIYLPQTQFSEFPPSLLVSTAPLQAKSKVRIIDGDNEYPAKLDQKLFGTTSVQRLGFHDLEGKTPASPKKSSFSNW